MKTLRLFHLHEAIMKVWHKPDPLARTLRKQVEQYCAWKAIRFPHIARRHREVLEEFFVSSNLPLELVEYVDISRYAETKNAEYERQYIYGVLRQFMRYWYRMGLLTEEFASVVKKDIISNMEEVHPTMHIDQARRVQEYKAEGLSLRQIKVRMETEDKKMYHLKQIQRWASYKLPSLSTG